MTFAATRVPSSIDDVDPQWLTAVLRKHKRTPDTATVSAIHPEQIAFDTGFSSRLYRLHIEGTSVPSTVIVKLPAASEARGAMEMMEGYTREVAFYQRVAGRAPLGTPDVYAALTSEETSDFVLVLEDLQHWENADHLAGLSLSRARRCIAELAGLHAWSTEPGNAGVLGLFPSMDTPMTRDILPAVFGQGWQVYREKTRASVPDSVAAFAERFAEHASTALQAMTERSMLVHGDIRADNMFFAGDRLKIVDFQLTARGVGVADIAYLVSQGLPTDERAGRDEELLREYLDLLSQHGITDYSFDDAWRHYQSAVAYLAMLPVIILVGWESLPERSRALCLTLVDRAVAAIDEIKAVEVFR